MRLPRLGGVRPENDRKLRTHSCARKNRVRSFQKNSGQGPRCAIKPPSQLMRPRQAAAANAVGAASAPGRSRTAPAAAAPAPPRRRPRAAPGAPLRPLVLPTHPAPRPLRKRGVGRLELPTTRTLSEYHTPRPYTRTQDGSVAHYCAFIYLAYSVCSSRAMGFVHAGCSAGNRELGPKPSWRVA